MNCPHCRSTNTRKFGIIQNHQRHKCKDCHRSWHEGSKHAAGWKKEEEFLLITVGQIPNLENWWNEHAKQVGWPRRTELALKHKLRSLGETSAPDESSGWVTSTMLLNSLGLSGGRNSSTFPSWVGAGLKTYKTAGGAHRVFLGDFVQWALSPVGSEKLSKSIRGNLLAIRWLLATIGEWKDKENPAEKRGRKRAA